MKIKDRFNEIAGFVGSIVFFSFIALIISIGFKWILTIVLVPVLLLLTLIGINISFEQDSLSTGIAVLSFVLALGYLLFGNRLIKRNG